MTALRDHVARFCKKNNLLTNGETVLVGVSGGADSLCLLDILRQIAPVLGIDLHVAHLNHGLRGADADADEAFVSELARNWQLPLHKKTVSVEKIAHQHKKSLEDAARLARYTFFAEIAQKISAQKVAVGHHADDQAETVLLHFLRGAGMDGLSGMRPSAPLPAESAAELIRPLLEISRAEIEDYCRRHALTPRFDASNVDEAFTRNRVRHTLIPLLETFNPNIRSALQRTAALMQADGALVEKEVERAWQFVVKSTGSDAIIFDRTDWQVLPEAAQARVLRRAIGQLQRAPTDIDFRHIRQALAFLVDADSGSRRTLPHNLQLWLQYSTIVLATDRYRPELPLAPFLPPGAEIPLAVPGNTRLPKSEWYVQTSLLDPATLSAAELSQNRPWQAFFDAEKLGDPVLRTRRPGDTFAPFGLDGHRQRLKKFMIDRKIPPAERDRIPLLVGAAGEICWVCGWRTAHSCRVTDASEMVARVVFKR